MPINVTIKAYSLSSTDNEYRALRTKLKARGLKDHTAIGAGSLPDGNVYTIDEKHLFGNQANTIDTPKGVGRRIFDWTENYEPYNRTWRYGYYLADDSGFAELQALRISRHQCGYCGAQYDDGAGEWCEKCLGSQYLKQAELRLLKLLPIADSFGGNRSEEPPEHFAKVMREKQAVAAKHRNKQKLADRLLRANKAVADAKLERDLIDRLIDNGICATLLSNLIYYSHTGRFCFGWNKLLTTAEANTVRVALDSFASGGFNVEIKEQLDA